MPSLDLYRKMFSVADLGEVHKAESELLLEQTWNQYIGRQVVPIYDWYHDPEKLNYKDLDNSLYDNLMHIDIHYMAHTSQTLDKDFISYHLEIRPSQRDLRTDYYDEYFSNRYGANWPCGMYVNIKDSQGRWQKWLVVAEADGNDYQYPTYEILRCDYLFQYIVDDIKYQIIGVKRSQNSYNSGIWSDHRVISPEDQQKFIIPINRDTEKIYYGLRMIIDAPVLTEPRTWQISKINRISSNGLVQATCAQDMFNPHTDYLEVEDGAVVGMWANYYSNNGAATAQDYVSETIPTSIYSTISYSGVASELKVGGSYKTFTVNFFDGEIPIDYQAGHWEYTIDGVDVSDKLIPSPTATLDANQIKIKFIDDGTYIGKIMTLKFVADSGITSDLQVEIKSL